MLLVQWPTQLRSIGVAHDAGALHAVASGAPAVRSVSNGSVDASVAVGVGADKAILDL